MDKSKLRAKFSSEEVENNWAISYGDMITLLLGFFVIFFNIKSETMNMALIQKDLDKYFQNQAQSQEGRKVAQAQEKNTESGVPIASTQLVNSLKVKSNLEGERILVEFPGVSFFNSANHQLTKSGKEVLQDFSEAIQGHLGQFRLVVRGYTDANPLSKNSQYKDNLELSAFRSISAIRFLAERGVNLSQMRIAGYGESSFSRQALSPEMLGDQRKIVIVIEPLDHTEKMESQGASVIPGKGIENVEKAEVPSRSVSSLNDKSPILSGIEVLLGEEVSLQNLEYNFNEVLFSIDDAIGRNEYYQKLVKRLVKRDLENQGLSEKEIEFELNKNKQRTKQ